MDVELPIQSQVSQVSYLSKTQATQGLSQQNLGKGKAVRSKSRKNDPADLSLCSQVLQSLIVSLTNLTKSRIKDFYPSQYDDVMDILRRAYTQGQNNSFILLSRTKQTLHAFINTINEEVQTQMKIWDPKNQLKVIRVNAILSNSEAKILMKLSDSLGLKHAQQAFHSLEMVNHIKEYFELNPNISVCFILEDIDYYVETTKQLLLYKILDMFGYLKVKFVFIATSVKVDIVDSFEKRIKSRFSHRMILFYEQSLDAFKTNLMKVFSELLETADQAQRDAILAVQSIVVSDSIMAVLEEEFEFGKNYEYLAQILRITISSLDQVVVKHMNNEGETQIHMQKRELFDYLKMWYLDQLKSYMQLKQSSEPIKVLEKMTKASLIVLISAKKVAERASVFNFDAVYTKYKSFTKNHQQIGMNLSKQVFIKIFLDLVHTGFLKSESETEILNVNNKIALGFMEKDLNEMLQECKDKLGLPAIIQTWAITNIM